MKRQVVDKLDVMVAAGLFGFVFLWALAFAHPFPHPDLWSPLAVAMKTKIGDASICGIWHYPVSVLVAFVGVKHGLLALGLAGKFALALTAGCLYLIFRKLWTQFRPTSHEPSQNESPFFFSKFLPMMAAFFVVLLPFPWRAYQFLSPDSLVLTLLAVAMLGWSFGRKLHNLLVYSFSYLIFGLVTAVNPFGFLLAMTCFIVNAVERWKSGLFLDTLRESGVEEGEIWDTDDAELREKLKKRLLTEKAVATVTYLLGFAGGLTLAVICAISSDAVGTAIADVIGWWLNSLLYAFRATSGSMGGRLAILFPVILLGSIMVAWRLNLDEERVRSAWSQKFFSIFFSFISLVFVCHSVGFPERARLALFRDYARLTAAAAKDVHWLFSDGRLDDALRISLAEAHNGAMILSVMNLPRHREIEMLKDAAPENGDRDTFAAGGMEIFKAWARERPDRLRESAWQLGGNIINIHGKLNFRTCGGLMRDEESAAALGEGTAAALDREMRSISERCIGVMLTRYSSGDLFGSADRALRTRFDSLLWRAARLAVERQQRLMKANDINESQKERVLATQLDDLNGTLKSQGEALERMLPTERLVLTPREALDVALKRADFQLARKYANQVLISSPDDQASHFALAMAAMQAKDWRIAVRHFEVVKLLNPGDAATLNNLSLCYMKLNRFKEAVECAERAAELQPTIDKIKRNLEELRKAAAAHAPISEGEL